MITPYLVLQDLLQTFSGPRAGTRYLTGYEIAAIGVISTPEDGDFHITVTREDEFTRMRSALDWINAEPEDPLKVQMWAQSALYGGQDLPDPALQELRRQEIIRGLEEEDTN